jgi:predicted nucleotidyltransferase
MNYSSPIRTINEDITYHPQEQCRGVTEVRQGLSVVRFREGDFVESKEGLIFDVKGVLHPPERVIAFVRYIPSRDGDRERRGMVYRKIYALSARYEFLATHYPQYLVQDEVLGACVNAVPLHDLVHHYLPQDKTRQLLRNNRINGVERDAVDFITLLREASSVAVENMGVSGSILVGLHTTQSDIDVIIYGRVNGFVLRNTMKQLLRDGEDVKAYGRDFLRRRYEIRQRATPVSVPDYVFHESRKSFQGTFKGRDFFLRYVKDWHEVAERYGDAIYRTMGYTTITGRVLDDAESLFTPCTYSLEDVEVLAGTAAPVTEVASFRGRFCEQAVRGEWIVAQGKLERVSWKGQIHHRLLLGNDPRDYMVTRPEREVRGEEDQ